MPSKLATLNGALIIKYIMKDEKVDPGETVVTSGGDRIFPKGLPVGKVVESTGETVPLLVAAGELLMTLTSTSVATTTTTSPIASQVKSPAGRPLEDFTGALAGAALAVAASAT